MSHQNHTSPTDLASVIKASRSGRRWLKFLTPSAVLLGITVVAIFVFGRLDAKPESRAEFQTQKISKGSVQLTITATGNLVPTNEVTIGSEISGLVSEVYVDTNDRVDQGQKLALIDTTSLENELRSTRASLESAKASVKESEASLKQAEATLKRYQLLREQSDGKIPSTASMEEAIAAVDIAEAIVIARKAAVLQSEAQIEIKETELSKAYITSPTNGIVLTRSIEPGQTVAASFSAPELFVIAEDLSKMKLEVAIAEADIGQLKSGQTASFMVDAWPQREFSATVTKVSFGSEVVENVVTYETELDLNNDELLLRPGMTATADIFVANHEDVWVVPVQALRFQPSLDRPASATGPGERMGPPDSDEERMATVGKDDKEKSSFLDKMLPGPPRRAGRRSGQAEEHSRKQHTGTSTVWVLENGHPRPIPVKIGLSDGSITEVSSQELKPDMEIILYQKPTVS